MRRERHYGSRRLDAKQPAGREHCRLGVECGRWSRGGRQGPADKGLCQSAWILSFIRQSLQRMSSKEVIQGDLLLGKELVAVRMMGLGRGEAGSGKAGYKCVAAVRRRAGGGGGRVAMAMGGGGDASEVAPRIWVPLRGNGDRSGGGW